MEIWSLLEKLFESDSHGFGSMKSRFSLKDVKKSCLQNFHLKVFGDFGFLGPFRKLNSMRWFDEDPKYALVGDS